MQKHFLKFRKVFINFACSPLILISNNSELAAKYLPNEVDQSIKNLEIQNINNVLFEGIDFKQEKSFLLAESNNDIILGDEISPDNCRLWDLNQKNDTIVSLDKDRFRNDLGGLIEAYSEINRRINNFILFNK